MCGPKCYDWLTGFESVKNWVTGIRSDAYRTVCLANLNQYLEFLHLHDPDELLTWDDKRVVNAILQYVTHKNSQGRHSTAEEFKSRIRSFYASNEHTLSSKRLQRHKVLKTEKSYQRIVPSKPQAYLLADSAGGIRNQAVILTMWQSGLRNSTFRHLKIRHVKPGLLRNETPLKIAIDPHIDKKSLKEPYYTFISHSAIDRLVAYLKTRDENIANIPDNEPLFLAEQRAVSDTKREMSIGAVYNVVKLAAKHAGLNPRLIWPHCLRKAFFNMMVGHVDDMIREFLMGHELQGSREAYFAPEWEKQIRAEYAKVNWDREKIVEKTVVVENEGLKKRVEFLEKFIDDIRRGETLVRPVIREVKK